MPQAVPPDLKKFLKPYDKKIQELALWMRDFVWKKYPGVNETIYDAVSAVALAYSFTIKWTDAFCHIAVYPHHVNFGFNIGARLKDPKKLLQGTGTSYRHIQVKNLESFPQKDIIGFLRQAVLLVNPGSGDENQIIIRVMNSDKKRRPKGK